jgi:phosphonate transport system permease protein
MRGGFVLRQPENEVTHTTKPLAAVPDPLRWAAMAREAAPRRGLGWYIAWGALALVLAASWQGADMRPLDLLRDSGNMATYAAEFFPPDFAHWRLYVAEMVVTLQIALWGTALAIVGAVPLSLLAASNVAPWWVNQPVRRVLDACRSINEMVFALIFVVAVGLGPFAGVLALWVHTTGVLAKLFSEAVEAIDPQPVEGLRATGAHPLAEVVYGVIPQVLPLWISYALYRFESNVRSASVVGMVGAGGIGMVLWEVIRGFQYTQTCAVLLMLVVSVTLIDLVSAQLRKRLI